MDTGYKFKNGKFVKRTEGEAWRWEAYFKEAETSAAKSKMPRSEKLFVRVTLEQADKLNSTGSFKCVMIFIMLSHQNFKHHGKSFEVPTEALVKAGFSRTSQWRALVQLEEADLISIEQRPPKPPVVMVR